MKRRFLVALMMGSMSAAALAAGAGAFFLRDAAARDSAFAPVDVVKDFRFTERVERREGALLRFFRLEYLGAGDRAMTLVYEVPLSVREKVNTFPGPDLVHGLGRRTIESLDWRDAPMGGGKLPRWPFFALTDGSASRAIGLAPGYAAAFSHSADGVRRVLKLEFHLGFTPERRDAESCVVDFAFDETSQFGFRGAWERWMRIFPAAFEVRDRHHGSWLVGVKPSDVPNWEDYGFRYRERGAHKTAQAIAESKWDAEHGIATMRYSSTGAWSMRYRVNKVEDVNSATLDLALKEAEAQAAQGVSQAVAWRSGCYHGPDGQPLGKPLNCGWGKGWVWSVKDAHDSRGNIDHRAPGEAERFDKLFGPGAEVAYAGEYCDSTDLFATSDLDYRREHFKVVKSPLTYAADSFRPAIFKGFFGFEYLHYLSDALHARGKLLMINAHPKLWSWVAPECDVLGTEAGFIDEKAKGFRPFTRRQSLLRRFQCGGKPYCIVQNTDFEALGAHMEKYMCYCLAYGFQPGCFSPVSVNDGSHYFVNPGFYERDRPLFRKYGPLCRKVSEAGWRPVNRLYDPKAEGVFAEQFGDRYVTVYVPPEGKAATIELPPARELVGGRAVGGKCELAPGMCLLLEFN